MNKTTPGRLQNTGSGLVLPEMMEGDQALPPLALDNALLSRAPAAVKAPATTSPLTIGPELEDNEDELIRLAHKKFLDGEDFKWIDYDQIDGDETLDDVK